MFGKIKHGKLVWRDQERNVIIGIFQNKNVKGTEYGKVSLTLLKGQYKESIQLSMPEFDRLIKLINRAPEIEIKKKEK